MIKAKLRTKLIFLIIAFILIPLVTMTLYLSIYTEESLRETTVSNFQAVGMEIGSEIERIVNNGRNYIVAMANNPILRSENATASEKLEQLNITQKFYQINDDIKFDDITLIDTKGDVITSTIDGYKGKWSANEWYKRSLNGNVVVSEAYRIVTSGKFVQLYLSPVSNSNDEIIGVIVGQIDLKHIWKIADSITIGNTGFVYMINNQSKIISHPNKEYLSVIIPQSHEVSKVLKNFTGTATYNDRFGEQIICSYTPILGGTIYDNNGYWGVIVNQQSDEVFKMVFSFQRNLIIITPLIIIGIIIGVSLFFSHSIITPIKKLEDGMGAVSSGNLDYHVDIKSGDEIEYLATSFNKMTDDLKSLNNRVQRRTVEVEKLLKHKDEFINQLGHDLKNPLLPLSNLLPILIEKVTDSKLKEMLVVIERNVDYMRNLVIKTIELARLNSPNTKFNTEDINLLDEIELVIEQNESILNNKNIEIENNIGKDIQVRADKLRLDELFTNLIGNAIKYSPKGGAISLNAMNDQDFVTVSISDIGIGITKDQIDHIFDEFYKADKARHDFDSSGLGLPICKRIVEKHGGKIWAISTGKNKGSSFNFTIPTGNKTIIGDIEGKIDKL